MNRQQFATVARHRLALEQDTIRKQAPFTVAMAYPSPYRVGMSSLGFLRIFRSIQEEPGMAAERVFLPDDAPTALFDEEPLSYESHATLTDFPVVAFSVAYELELAGLVQMLHASSIPIEESDRGDNDPLIVCGGPLTFSNPLPLALFADVLIVGEADSLAIEVFRIIREHGSRDAALKALAEVPHVYVPRHHAGQELPPVAQCDNALLPAWSNYRTPETELSNMFLVEAERGCSRGCTYCVMRRSTNGGMRIVPADKLLGLIPDDAPKVGLVGAAVSDHPQIVDIVNELVARGKTVGLSSLRPDRLNDAFVGALKAAGYRTLTTAMDGTSDRVREVLDRRARRKHLVRAAELCRAHNIPRLKLYLMIGIPGETEDDVDECAAFVTELSKIIPVALTVAPFCAKRNTPLDGQPFAGIKLVDKRLARLRQKLRGRAEVRATSARWAWVEYVLAQGGVGEARALAAAVAAGGRFSDYRKAFAARPEATVRKKLFVVRDQPVAGMRAARWLEATPGSTETIW